MLTKVSVLFLVSILAAACGTHHKRIGPDDLLLADDAQLTPPLGILSAEQTQLDLDLLMYAFNKGYGGRKFIPSGQYEKTREQLLLVAAQAPTGAQELCRKIDEALLQVTDFHLSVHIDGRDCSPLRKGRLRQAGVGKNVSSGKEKPWSITATDVKGHRIPLISITAFPNHEDPVWNGFLEAVLKERRSAKAVILDFRGNGGGDDTTGRRLASYFYGQDFLSPVHSQVKSQTPETLAMVANHFKRRILRYKSRGEAVPEFWVRRLSETMSKYNAAKAGQVPAEHESFNRDGKSFDPKKAYTKPIYILMDAECASACESTVEAFEMHPYAITVGENTAGFVHFGNMGFVVLPFSKISVQMATDYWKFKDGRFVEGVGYAPKIPVPMGTDALDAAKKELAKRL